MNGSGISKGTVLQKDYSSSSVFARWLTSCVETDDEEGVRRNLGYGISPTALDSLGRTALHVLSCTRKENIMRMLLAAITVAQIDVRDEFQTTPLHTAAYKMREDVMNALIAHGADQTLKDFWGLTAAEILQKKTKEREVLLEGMKKV